MIPSKKAKMVGKAMKGPVAAPVTAKPSKGGKRSKTIEDRYGNLPIR